MKKLVLASTSSVYGDNGVMPSRTSELTDHPLAPYAASKKAAEVLCYSYHFLYGIDVSTPRCFIVYGPAGRPEMSYFRFIKDIDRGRPIPVFCTGRQKRDFTYIDDIAFGTLRCLESFGYEVFNLGNDRPVELQYVIGLIEQELHKKAVIEWFPIHPADVEATWADISSTRDKLSWSPTVSIEEGVKQTVAWYVANRDFVGIIED